MLDIGDVARGMMTVNGLVEIGADGLEFLLQDHHFFSNSRQGFIAEGLDGGFTEDSFRCVLAKRSVDGVAAQCFTLRMPPKENPRCEAGMH